MDCVVRGKAVSAWVVLSFTKEYVIQGQTHSIFIWGKGGTTCSDFSTRQLFLNFHNVLFLSDFSGAAVLDLFT